MAFDRSRPVPWRPLLRWALITAAVLNVAFYLLNRDNYTVATPIASVMGAGMYLIMGAVLSKFGWQPAGLMGGIRPPTPERRTASTSEATSTSTAASGAPRRRPAATKRTNATNRRTPPKRR
jgi:hypothetical protein